MKILISGFEVVESDMVGVYVVGFGKKGVREEEV
jgi:hypothetical protein